MSVHRLSLLAATMATAAVLSAGGLFAGTASAATPSLVPASATANCHYQVSWNIDALNVRSGPGTNNRVIGTLAPGSYVASPYCSDWVQGQGGNGWWVYVVPDNGSVSGWVSTMYLNGLP